MPRFSAPLVAVLYFLCVLSTNAFLDLRELNAIKRDFIDVFMELGGERLLGHLQRGESVDVEAFKELDGAFDLKCLLTTIRPNKYPFNPKCYETVQVCLTDDDCPKDKREKIEFTGQLDASGNEFRYLNNESSITPDLHGTFWLRYAAGWSSIMSFAESKDKGVLSNGKFESDKEDIAYRIRLAGDRIWAFAEKGFPFDTFQNMQTFDYIYEFGVTEGSDEDPLAMQIYLSLIIPAFPLLRFHIRQCLDWSFSYEMFLETDDNEKGKYNTSVVWRRLNSGIFLEDFKYSLIQVIDGSGNPIEPAYSKWLELQSDEEFSGTQPNVNVFRALRDKPFCTKGS